MIKSALSRHHALILAGGRGTRFWPRSRKARAKQVLDFLGAGTLVQQTVDRLTPLLPPSNIWILTNDHLRAEIIRQLPQVPKSQIIAEPAGRNTAPAIGLAARIMHDVDPDAVMGVFPADQFVSSPAPFRKLLRSAFKAASSGQMALIGIQPRWPETGYGYVEFPKGAMQPGSLTPIPVVRFREKPDLATAKKFVKAGHFGWNAGIFFWRADVFSAQLWQHLPKTAALLDSLPHFGSRQFSSKLAAVFPQCENISVDYAIMERASGVVGFTAGDVGWNDVGSFNAVYELLSKDPAANASKQELLTLDAHGNYVDAPGKLIALLGVDDLIVVDTPDALLVTRRHLAQKVGDAVKLLEKQNRHELL
jgi:mannose-1-phosphate guanylyltransferase